VDDPARVNGIAKAMSDDDVRQAAEWFASMKLAAGSRLLKLTAYPKSYVSVNGRQRLPLPGGGAEPLGNRILELPPDVARATSRDPHSGFVAYLLVGSIAKGAALVKTGGSNKTITCGICHGDLSKAWETFPGSRDSSPPTWAARSMLFKPARTTACDGR
jgi:cytochrome c553